MADDLISTYSTPSSDLLLSHRYTCTDKYMYTDILQNNAVALFEQIYGPQEHHHGHVVAKPAKESQPVQITGKMAKSGYRLTGPKIPRINLNKRE